MKRTLFLSVLFGMLLTTAHAENESHQQVESTLYAYYRWCNNNIRDTAVLSKADTLFRLSGEKHDIRMQAVALSLKADHYYFNNNLDSLKAWIPRVQDFARKNDQIKYYYFTWSRLILYYTKQAQYTLAQYELEQYMSQAEKDNYKPATAEAYKQLGHIYRTRGLKKPAVEYYRKAIDFIIQNGLNTFHLSNLYSELATMLMDLQRYPEAAEAVEKGKACIPLPDYIWGLKAKETHLLAQTGQTDKAKALFNEIKAGQNGNLSEIKLAEIEVAIYNHSHEYGKMIAAIDKLIRSFEREGYKESYFYYLYENRAAAYAALGNFEAAYRDIQHYTELYHKQVNDDNEKTLGEFATLLDVNRLNMEKAELRQQAQEERLHRTQLGTIGLACILLLAAVFIAVMLRMNRHLARAKRAAEESNRMKGIFIRNITHEINTPLNSIVGFSQILSSYYGDNEDTKEYAHIIEQNSTNLLQLINDVLDLSYLDGEQNIPAETIADITGVCQTCIDQTYSYLKPNVQLIFTPERENFSMQTNPERISQVLMSLLQNAAKFTTHGSISLSYHIREEEKMILFSVTDTGIGIPIEKQESVFERFNKLDTFMPGTGLGLSISRLIVEKMGGSLTIDSTYTTGSRFILILPLKE